MVYNKAQDAQEAYCDITDGSPYQDHWVEEVVSIIHPVHGLIRFGLWFGARKKVAVFVISELHPEKGDIAKDNFTTIIKKLDSYHPRVNAADFTNSSTFYHRSIDWYLGQGHEQADAEQLASMNFTSVILEPTPDESDLIVRDMEPSKEGEAGLKRLCAKIR